MRAILLSVMAALGLLVAGCVKLSPEQEARHTIIWQAAKACEARYRTIRVRHIDSINNIVHLEDYAQAEVQEFMDCLNERLR